MAKKKPELRMVRALHTEIWNLFLADDIRWGLENVGENLIVTKDRKLGGQRIVNAGGRRFRVHEDGSANEI